MCKSYEDSEIVIGLVAPVGVDNDSICEFLEKIIRQFGYKINIISLSRIIQEYGLNDSEIDTTTQFNRINSLMTAGNEFREKAKNNGILAMYAVQEILEKREKEEKRAPLKKHVHIIRSLKNPEEAMVLRRVYSDGFFLLGISSSVANRSQHLINNLNMEIVEADKLITRDEHEDIKHGQRFRDIYHLADAFIDLDRGIEDYQYQLTRIIELIFGNPFFTPTKDEYAMFLACASALRSGDLSRQVGAVIMSKNGEIISSGSNDVPKFGGGLYWPNARSIDNDNKICRDIEKGFDSNEHERNQMVKKIKLKYRDNLEFYTEKAIIELGRKALKDTGVLEITEYGRAVHAEMEAILSCARSGVSTKDTTLYCTTFPCHNCAKHIVASGITKVIFIEPYPKSHALSLHSDSICLSTETEEIPGDKVVFQPFVGIAQRRYIDIFSIKKSTVKVEREQDGIKRDWNYNDANIPLPLSLLPASYIDREKIVSDGLKKIIVSIQD